MSVFWVRNFFSKLDPTKTLTFLTPSPTKQRKKMLVLFNFPECQRCRDQFIWISTILIPLKSSHSPDAKKFIKKLFFSDSIPDTKEIHKKWLLFFFFFFFRFDPKNRFCFHSRQSPPCVTVDKPHPERIEPVGIQLNNRRSLSFFPPNRCPKFQFFTRSQTSNLWHPHCSLPHSQQPWIASPRIVPKFTVASEFVIILLYGSQSSLLDLYDSPPLPRNLTLIRTLHRTMKKKRRRKG